MLGGTPKELEDQDEGNADLDAEEHPNQMNLNENYKKIELFQE